MASLPRAGAQHRFNKRRLTMYGDESAHRSSSRIFPIAMRQRSLRERSSKDGWQRA